MGNYLAASDCKNHADVKRQLSLFALYMAL